MFSVRFSPVNFSGRTANLCYSNPNVTSPLVSYGNDVFVRSANSCEAVSGGINEKRIEEIYNQTYETFISQNPIIGELNYTRPKLIISHDKDSSADAKYNRITNNISLSANLNKDLFIVGIKDNKGKYVQAQLMSKDSVDTFLELLKGKIPDDNIKVLKLNSQEKEVWLSSAFAHELRHSMQSHLVLSTQGCSEQYKEHLLRIPKFTQAKRKEIEGFIQQLNWQILQITASPLSSEQKNELLKQITPKKEQLEEYCKKFKTADIKDEDNYLLTYQPKKLLPSDTIMPIFPGSSSYWSIKDHFAPFKSAGSANGDEKQEIYISDPNEIDAYLYGADFLSFTDNPQARQEVIDLLILQNENTAYEGIGLMEKYGYPSLIY
ncbi:MAG: hypothetical protein IJ877_02205 [Candidatus Gastranaerophilales bacterium]|nr:hypothetical protein [Candidatus Gastranaerophilales bacterium]